MVSNVLCVPCAPVLYQWRSMSHGLSAISYASNDILVTPRFTTNKPIRLQSRSQEAAILLLFTRSRVMPRLQSTIEARPAR